MGKRKNVIFELLLLLIITAPAFLVLLNNRYFSMHDDQQIARLFLLDRGIRQGYLYPRWVDYLGFGFGYPLYNFYPPLVYYIGEIFHFLGFSFIWSIKLTFILGFYLSALGTYILTKKFIGRAAAFVSAVLITYFFYHTVLIYVRGALAEFFSLAILPYLILTFQNLFEKVNLKYSILFGLTMALLILDHPLIALPAVFYLAIFFIFYLILTKDKVKFMKFVIISGLIGLSLSAFFWLPSLMEKKYTLTDKILTSELASYKLYYVCPQQFIYSPWGYGGSAPGCIDGFTYQLGKIDIGLVLGAIVLSLIYLTIYKRKGLGEIKFFYLFLFLLIFSLFMTTQYSYLIWDNISYLWYLQFPWRFLTFAALFISLAGSYFVFFLIRLIGQYLPPRGWGKLTLYGISTIIILLTIFIYGKYFKPQRLIDTTDKDRTTYEEIAWRISSTSYEFVPKGVKTKKTELNTTTLAISKNDLPLSSYKIILGKGAVKITDNRFGEKSFSINATTGIIFRLNTYNFPGWVASIDGKYTGINDLNDLKLITIDIPKGQHEVKFIFTDTTARKFGNIISLASLITLILSLIYFIRPVKK